MAKITINIGPAKFDDVVEAFNVQYNGRPNGMTDEAWVRQCLKKHILGIVGDRKRQLSHKAADDDVAAAISALDGVMT